MKKTVSIVIGLILALALVAAGIVAVIWFSIGPNTKISFNADLVSVTVDETKTVPADKLTALNVSNDAGNISIQGGDVKQITVKAHKTSWANTKESAQEGLKDIKYEVVQQGNTLQVIYETGNQLSIGSSNQDTIDFTITVPAKMGVTVNAGSGEISLSDIKGNGDLQSSFGDITVQNLDGALKVDTDSGRVSASTVKAGNKDIDLHSGYGDIDLKQASGAAISLSSNSGALDLNNVRATKDLNLSSEFGNIKFETGAANSLTIKGNSGSVTLASVTVKGIVLVDNDFGDMTLEKLTAESFDLQTNSGTISIDGAQGEIKAQTDFGDITVKNAENVILDLDTNSGSIDFAGSLGDGSQVIHSGFGDIDLALPSDTKLNVDLETKFGSIESEIAITSKSTNNSNDVKMVGTINGGGGLLQASTDSGDIIISSISAIK